MLEGLTKENKESASAIQRLTTGKLKTLKISSKIPQDKYDRNTD